MAIIFYMGAVTPFTKMHGLGNDFVVFNAIEHPLPQDADLFRRIADRRLGIGCDQILLVGKATQPDADFNYRIFNADGGEVEQCGNGVRCFARYVHDKGLTDKTDLVVETLGGIVRTRLRHDGLVSVDMGVPRFEPSEIPFEAGHRQQRYSLEVNGETVELGIVSMGNPHAVQLVPDVEQAPVATQGPQIESHPRFPDRVNAGFMQINDRGHIGLRVYERGVGETRACGTGACAAVVTGRQAGLLDDTVVVELPGGSLEIHWEGEGHPVEMTGPAVTVFEGSIDLARLKG